MCRKCVGHFLNVRTYYRALEHSETDGMNCKSILTSQDKVEIVKATYAYIVGDHGLWSKGFCSSCFTKPLTHESKLTAITNDFFAPADSVQDCFGKHPNASYLWMLGRRKAGHALPGRHPGPQPLLQGEDLPDVQFPQLDGICWHWTLLSVIMHFLQPLFVLTTDLASSASQGELVYKSPPRWQSSFQALYIVIHSSNPKILRLCLSEWGQMLIPF